MVLYCLYAFDRHGTCLYYGKLRSRGVSWVVLVHQLTVGCARRRGMESPALRTADQIRRAHSDVRGLVCADGRAWLPVQDQCLMFGLVSSLGDLTRTVSPAP